MKKILTIVLILISILSCRAQKISELPETTTLEASDEFVVRITAGTRKITWNNVLGIIIDSSLVLFPTQGEYLTAADLDTLDLEIPAMDSTTTKLLLSVWTDTTKVYRKHLSENFKKIDSTAFFIDTTKSFFLDGDTLKIKDIIPGFTISEQLAFQADANLILPWSSSGSLLLGGLATEVDGSELVPIFSYENTKKDTMISVRWIRDNNLPTNSYTELLSGNDAENELTALTFGGRFAKVNFMNEFDNVGFGGIDTSGLSNGTELTFINVSTTGTITLYDDGNQIPPKNLKLVSPPVTLNKNESIRFALYEGKWIEIARRTGVDQ